MPPVSERTTDRTLVVAPSWVGDAVMMQPLLARLQAQAPDSPIDVYAAPHLLPLLARMPGVDQALPNPFGHGQVRLAERWRAGRSLRGRYRRAYILPNTLKSALMPFAAAIPERVGYQGEMRYGLLNDRRRLDRDAVPRLVDRYAALADAARTSGVYHSPDPVLLSSPSQQAATLQQLGLHLDQPAIAFCPGAEFGPAKRWPPRHFARMGHVLLKRGFQIWLIGGPKDQTVAEDIRIKLNGAARNLCGQTDLGAAVDLLAAASLVVTNDSGLMHVAAAVGTRVLALFGSSSPRFTPPLSPRAHTISLQLPCSPCFERHCPLGHFRCLNDIHSGLALQELGKAFPDWSELQIESELQTDQEPAADPDLESDPERPAKP